MSALLLLGLMLPGCTKANLRAMRSPQDEWSTLPQSLRRADQPGSASAYSNKARQIERNLGVPDSPLHGRVLRQSPAPCWRSFRGPRFPPYPVRLALFPRP